MILETCHKMRYNDAMRSLDWEMIYNQRFF